MIARETFHQLDAKKWAATSAQRKLQLLVAVRDNLKRYAVELARSEGEMKDALMGEVLFSDPESMLSTAVLLTNTLSACIRLYRSLAKGKMLKPSGIGCWKLQFRIGNGKGPVFG